MDDNWDVTRIIDLEWACTLPIQMLSTSYWLTNRGVDGLTGSHLDEYKTIYHEFVDTLEKEEKVGEHSDLCSEMLRGLWSTGRIWYIFALNCPEALWAVFTDHIQPKFGECDKNSCKVLMQQWDAGASDFISSKVVEQEGYRAQIREMFAAAAAREVEEALDGGR